MAPRMVFYVGILLHCRSVFRPSADYISVRQSIIRLGSHLIHHYRKK